MGERFGGSHADDRDAVTGLSSMTVLSDLPGNPDYDPGRFHILLLGIYVVLEPFANFYFSGRMQHGGTPPIAPRGQEPESWQYRAVVISYPSGKVQQGLVRHAFASMSPEGDPFFLSPEMTGVL